MPHFLYHSLRYSSCPLSHLPLAFVVAFCALRAVGAGAQSSKAEDLRQWVLTQPPVNNAPGYPPLGCQLSTPQAFRNLPHFRVLPATRGDRPAQVLLTEFLPPIGDQGRQGSCAAWSTGYYFYSYAVAMQLHLSAEQRAGTKFEYSPAYLYHLRSNRANAEEDKRAGMTLADAFGILKEKGCASLTEMPFQDTDDMTPPDPTAIARASRYKAREIASLFGPGAEKVDTEKLKTYLAETRQPCVIAIHLFNDFPKLHQTITPDFVYSPANPSRETFIGNHAITVVGYDEAKKAFRIVNSWTAQWGDKGFLWMSEDYLKDYVYEAWGAEAGGPVARRIQTPHVKIVK